MTTLRRYPDGQVLKLWDPSDEHPCTNLAELVKYVEILKRCGIRLPGDLAIVDVGATLGVRHSWICGPTLPELASTDPDQFVTAVYRIAEWTENVATSGARLDTNLANFIIAADGRLTCIDVIPALLAPLRRTVPEDDDWTELYNALCFDPNITICSLAGSALRVLLALHGPEQAVLYAPELALLCPRHDHPENLPAWWFHTRLHVATQTANGQIPPAVANTVFTAMSIARLRDTPPPGRQTRINATKALLTKLDLNVPVGGGLQ